jgi:succinoglycan biosynthesis protein ExoM
MAGASTIEDPRAAVGLQAGDPLAGAEGAAPWIDVCVCTWHRRDGLRRLLAALAEQQGAPRFRVLVADNHAEPVEADTVAAFAAHSRLRLHYLHAPADNIAIARNACLDAARAPLLAFIDDDEVPAPDWLAALAREQRERGADALIGPVRAVYPAGTPAWLVDGAFHAKWPNADRAGRCRNAYTANALVVRARTGGLRFDPNFGSSGGEDTLWFARLRGAGLNVLACASATVEEAVDPARLSLSWLCRRSFGSGQTHARVSWMLGRSRAWLACSAALKSAFCLVAALGGAAQATAWRRWLIRACLHAGVAHAALGGRALGFYGAPSGSRSPR